MRKKLLAYIIFSLFLFTTTYAQLSGTYTIGTSAADYTTIGLAVGDLLSNGVNGTVTFNIQTGTYAEAIYLPTINGVSAANTVTFQSETGNVADVLIQTLSANPTSALVFIEDCPHIQFKHLHFDIGTQSINSFEIYTSDSLLFYDILVDAGMFRFDTSHYVTIKNSTILDRTYCYYSEYATMDSNTFAGGGSNSGSWDVLNDNGHYFIFTNNKLTEQKLWGWANYCLVEDNIVPSMQLNWSNNIFRYNETYNGNLVSAGSNNIVEYNTCHGGSYGIIVLNGSNNVVNGNVIYDVINYGIQLYSGTDSVLITNNMIGGRWVTSSPNDRYGIYSGGASNVQIYNNTIHMNAAPATQASTGIHVNGTNYDVKNNLVLSENIFTKCIYVETGSNWKSDYNQLINNSGGPVGYYNSSDVYGLSNWQTTTSQDSNSQEQTTTFVADTNLHLASFSGAMTGIPLPEVIYDIDFEIRDTMAPLVGADENGVLTYDLLLSSINSPVYSCNNASDTINITIQNNGVNTVDSGTAIPVAYAVDDTLIVRDTIVLWINLAGGEYVDFTFASPSDFSYSANTLSSWIEWSLDPSTSNDSAIVFLYDTVKSINVLGSDTSICNGTSVLFDAGGSWTNYIWSTGVDTSVVDTGAAGEYWVEITDSNGCIFRDTVILTVINCDIVWPGDCDNNGVCNIFDILPLGLNYGVSGTARDSIDIGWFAHYCQNWSDSSIMGVNPKYSDADGSGQVDLNDMTAITANFSLVHSKKNGTNNNAGNPDLYFEILTDDISPGTNVDIAVMAGTSSLSLHGIAYEISLSMDQIQENTVTISYNDSWLVQSDTNYISFVIIDNSNDKLYVACSRTDQQNVTNSGKLATISFIIDTSAATGSNISISLSSSGGVDQSGNSVTFNNSTDSSAITIPITTGINQNSFGDLQAAIYPNPNSGNFVLVFETFHSQDITIILSSIDGRVVFGEQLISFTGRNKIEFNLAEYAKGFYSLKIISEDGVVTKKVIYR